MKIKVYDVYLECFGCATPGRSRHTTQERLDATFEFEKKTYRRICRSHWAHEEKRP